MTLSRAAFPPRSPSRRAVLAGTLAGTLGCALAARPAGAAPATASAVRIASLGGAVTEILWRLGAGPRVAIVDTTSVYPAEVLRERPNAGYLRALSAEGLLSVGPDLVLAAEGAGPPAVLALLREAGVPVETIREPSTAEGVLDKIAVVGRLTGLDAAAEGLRREVAARFAALAERRARVARPARALVVLSQTGGRVMVGGRGSTADGILALAGLVNAADGIEGFKPITDEALVGAAPDAVIMMVTEGRRPTPESVFAGGTALGQTPAAARRALVTLDGLALLGFGPRTPEAAGELMRAIYPDLPPDLAPDLPRE